MHVVAAHRGATLETLIPALDGMPSMAQAKWSLGAVTESMGLPRSRSLSPRKGSTAPSRRSRRWVRCGYSHSSVASSGGRSRRKRRAVIGS